jgi:hypothetical protein
MITRTVNRYFLIGLAVFLLYALASSTDAFASGGVPWWSPDLTITPATDLRPGETGEIIVSAIDVGTSEAGVVNGVGAPVVLTDRLPAGVVATHIAAGIGPSAQGGEIECSLGTVSCTVKGTIPPYVRVAMIITVEVEPGAKSGGIDEALIEGGGAAPIKSKRAVEIGGSPTTFGVESYELTPESFGGAVDTQAGSHPFQLTTTLNINQDLSKGLPLVANQVKDLQFELPPGLIGDPTAVPQCTTGEFEPEFNKANRCPPNTAIGVANVTLIVQNTPGLEHPATLPQPIFNLEPQPGEPARFGFLADGVPVLLDTAVRTGGDYGVRVTVHNISQIVDFVGTKVTFWGVPADPRHDSARGWNCNLYGGTGPCLPLGATRTPPFLTLPTSCTTPWTSTVAAYSWLNPSVGMGAQYSLVDQFGDPLGLTGCNRLSFEPSITVTPDGEAASTPTGLSVGIHVPQDASLNPSGVSASALKQTTVTLPAGVSIDPAGADGLQACGLSQVGLESPSEQSCPEAAKIGTAEISTPLLPNPLVGAVYLAEQNANPFGSLVAMYLIVKDPVSGVIVKLAGEVKPDPVTGQLTATFDETPDLPFEDATLHFFGGSRAPLGTPTLCGEYTTVASFAPWSGNGPVDANSTFEINSGPNHSPCASPLPFGPSLTAGTTSIQAGGFSPFTMTMSREDGDQNLQSIQLHMPPGLLGTLSNVKLCGEPQADQGTCGPESLIGETTVSVGLGGNPYSVTGGKVYITGPYRGAPYGLSIVNPAKAGPFDLGNVIVRAMIEVNPSTAALTITTDPSGPYAIPHILDGIPLQIKHVNVSINRPDFTFNPTNCDKLAITGTLGSSEGSTSALSVPMQVTNCAVLAFKPKLTATSSGKTSRLDGASLGVKLAYPAGPYDANIARVKVELPKQLPSRLPTLQKACLAATFEANPANCPPASIIGHATATTPVLPVPLTGPAYFVSHGGEAFPSLIIVLQGYGATVDLVGSTFISKTGVTSSTFKTIPDVPVGTFELNLPQGPYSALTTDGNLCQTKNLAMPTEFIGQNGAELHTSTKIEVTGCPKTKKATHKKKHKAKAKHKHGKPKK